VTFGMTELLQFEFNDCTDTANPNFTLDVEFEADQIMAEEDGRLYVSLRPGSGFNDLPYEFVASHTELSGVDDEDDLVRTHPFVLPTLYSCQTSYRIVPPDGFEADPLPGDHEFRVGTFHVAVDYRLDDDGAVEVIVSLDVGDGKLTPDQVETFRDEFLILSGDKGPEDWVLPISFNYIPRRLIDEGHVIEGLRQMVETAHTNPGSLFNRGELAKSLVSVGLGEEAREIALKMVEEDPESARAHRTVGWAHMHDLLGADLHFGIDRDRAIKAFQRAIQLDDLHVVSRYNLAVLLEHDDLGARYSDSDDLLKAADAYQWFHKMYPWDTAVGNHAVVLAHLRDKRQLRRLTTTYPDLLAILPSMVALEVIDRGVRSGDRLFSRASDQEKLVLRARTAALLRSLREYDILREYLDQFPKTKAAFSKVESLGRFEDIRIDPSKPESVVQEFLARFLFSGQDVNCLRELFANANSDADYYESVRSIPTFFHSVRTMSLRAYGRKEVSRDIISLYSYQVAGDDTVGYVVTATGVEGADLPQVRQFVVRDGEHYRLFCPGKNSCEIGKLALGLIDEGDVDAARIWMDRVFEVEKEMIRLLDPLAGSPFARIRSYCANDDIKTLRLAAVCLSSRDGADQKWIPELDSIRPAASALQQLQIDRVKRRLLEEAGRNDEALEIATTLLKGYPKFLELLMTKYHTEINLGRLDDAAATLELIAEVDQWYAVIERTKLMHAKGGHEAVFQYVKEMIRDGQFTEINRNAMAWRSLFVGKSDQVVEEAKQAVDQYLPGDPRRASALHTLASVYADVGELKLAAETVRATIAARNGVRDGIDDWVLGRIAEHCGLKEAAKKYYRRVKDSLVDTTNDASCTNLADYRLEMLSAP
ncbi:MAG: tetratricopeptide repeat protein, partial [Planctomycetales bacterium]|nr:tetratricopeptide repeat protein [Planctomycetales bacterium]